MSAWLKRSLLGLLASLGIFIALFLGEVSRAENANQAAAQAFFERAQHGTQGHTNNWAVLVCASRYWFNYRHMANALGMYRTVKRLGIPDSNIILMLADDAACNSRNKFPGTVYANPGRQMDLYGDNIEVDYRGYEVTVENFIRVLTGRVEPSLPRSKRLLTDDRSNIFVYMTGHGGNEFLKFQDNEEISAFDIADAFEQMWQKKRYNEIFFMIDTCQANTMYSKFYSPNIIATGSSELGENSYSHENDHDIGVAVIDSYTHYILQYLEQINKTSKATMADLFANYNPVLIKSHAGVRSDLFNRPLSEAKVTDFFGGVAQVEVLEENMSSWTLRDSNRPQQPASHQSTPKPVSRSRSSSLSAKPRLQATWNAEAEKQRQSSDFKGAWAATAVVGGLILWSRLRTMS
ncbi:glycosylphosphatidylinositol anchor biosynthesis [Ceratobasidium sp. 395]|nr:glycosylphosphatidylinositol anchor biosynthesis [Ceratobasidium sp. 395]